MTLTEFLLARIAEDEAATYMLDDYVQQGAWGVTRVLAECEAKRQIVERCRPTYAIVYSESERLLAEAFDQTTFKTVAHSGPIWPSDQAEATLRDLASVYADHPDYDQAWRP